MNAPFSLGTGDLSSSGDVGAAPPDKQLMQSTDGWLGHLHGWYGIWPPKDKGTYPFLVFWGNHRVSAKLLHIRFSSPSNESISSFYDYQETVGVLWIYLLDPASLNWGMNLTVFGRDREKVFGSASIMVPLGMLCSRNVDAKLSFPVQT